MSKKTSSSLYVQSTVASSGVYCCDVAINGVNNTPVRDRPVYVGLCTCDGGIMLPIMASLN